MFREYTPHEAEFLGKELADFIINNYNNGIIPDEKEVVEFMSAAYGVPEEFTKSVLRDMFGQPITQKVVMFFYSD